jgi:murein DD-endopeptidase MepM/ murein hydrolase activator NlpD
VDWGSFGRQIGMGILKSVVMFPMQWYGMEGDTKDGKYNPKGVEFRGYPKAATSPYKLPYPKGTHQFVGQANQGLFSHMAFNETLQIYAYDFAHDFGDDILASRDGTVVDYFDWITDNTHPHTAAEVQVAKTAAAGQLVTGQSDWVSWNFIIIRHDTINPDHDLDAGNETPPVPVTTYAVYGHGKQSGVRDAFATRGVADPKTIIGQTVKQGDVIMKAGSTGMSFHNHLHMHVQVLDTTTPATDPVADRLKHYTIPFVFQEVHHVIGADGVLKHLNWYTSDNGAA